MFTKRALPQLEELSPSKRLKHNLEDLFLTGTVSGKRAQTLFANAEAAAKEPGQFNKLAAAGVGGKKSGNAHRDILRQLVKGKGWPTVYVAYITAWDKKAFRAKQVQCAFLLPHEIIRSLLAFNDVEKLCCTDRLSPRALRHLVQCKDKLHDAMVVPIGLWGDGCPVNYDRTESVEMITMSLPGLTDKGSCFRVPLVGLSKRFVMTDKTYDSIFEVLAWSFEALASGRMPSTRHDGSHWSSSDAWRRRLSDKAIGVKGVLAEIRADWQFLSSCFRLPYHNLNAGCCWRCRVTPALLKDFSSSAAWRSQRLNNIGLLCRMQEQGVVPSSVFKIPYMDSSIFAIDWLHCCDKGTASYFLGNLLWHCLPKLEGGNKGERVQSLWRRIENFYSRHPVDSKYDSMTLLMIKQPKKGPALRGKAAEVRGLVPFGLELAQELLAAGSETDKTICECAKQLNECYNCLHTNGFEQSVFQDHVNKFCMLYAALDSTTLDEKSWKIKPKFHLMAEMGMDDTCPSVVWTYRDEDFGGTAAALSRRRGGKHSVISTSITFLTKFLASNRIPVL
jgi:hypothetical protein